MYFLQFKHSDVERQFLTTTNKMSICVQVLVGTDQIPLLLLLTIF